MNHELINLPPGHVGAVVTFLEMTTRPADLSAPPSPLRMEPWDAEPADYRRLFAKVGGRWLWFSRLAMDDAELRAKLGQLHLIRDGEGGEAGFIELDFGTPGHCQIRFLGLVPERAGRGHGRWLFAETLIRAWASGVTRVGVHTCSLDHPAALPSYLRAGFSAYARAFEHFPDPRLAGLLPRDVAPQIPLFEGGGR